MATMSSLEPEKITVRDLPSGACRPNFGHHCRRCGIRLELDRRNAYRISDNHRLSDNASSSIDATRTVCWLAQDVASGTCGIQRAWRMLWFSERGLQSTGYLFYK